MPIDIPEEDQRSIAIINTVPDKTLEKFISILESAPPISNPAEMTQHVAKQLPSISTDKLERIVDVLYTLYLVRELSGVRPKRFFADLMEVVRKNSSESALKGILKLESQLEKLLNIETLATISKAARLQRDGERLYCEAKILSDIRPVFGSKATVRPAGAVLVHTLKIGYHEGRDHREVHFAMDSADLEALSTVLRRAQEKDKTLRDLLKKSKLPNLE
jgi:hypothetical protein